MHERVFHQHATMRGHAQARQQVLEHAAVGFGPPVTKHAHAFDAHHVVEQVRNAEAVEHALCVVQWRVGEQHALPFQMPQSLQVTTCSLQVLQQVRQVMGLLQKVVWVHRVVFDQTEQRGTVTLPITKAQSAGLLRGEFQLALDVRVHRQVQLTEHVRACVVQRVVHVEEPHALGVGC